MELGVSYFGNRILQHYRERDLPAIVAQGCNYVVHTLSEEDFWFYPETMQEIVEVSHQEGLKVHLDPWGVGGVFSGETFSKYLLDEPQTWQMTSSGEHVPRACLRSPVFRQYMRKWIEMAIELRADAILWDEPQLSLQVDQQFAEKDLTCWCLECRDSYRQLYGEIMPTETTAGVLEFRENTVISFLAELCAYSNQFGIKNAVCLKATENVFQGINDLTKVVDIPAVDILGVTPFWHLYGEDPITFVGHWAKKIEAVCALRGIESQIWLPGFLIAGGRELEIALASEAAIQAGVTNLAVWGMYGCSHMSALKSEHPEEVWKVVGNTFNKLKTKK